MEDIQNKLKDLKNRSDQVSVVIDEDKLQAEIRELKSKTIK